MLEKAALRAALRARTTAPTGCGIPAARHPPAARGIAPDGAGPGADRARRADRRSTGCRPTTGTSSGQHHRPSDPALLAVLGALGAQVDTPDDLADAVRVRAARDLASARRAGRRGRGRQPARALVCACPPGRSAARARRSRSRAAATRCTSSSSARCRSPRSRPSTARSDASCAVTFPELLPAGYHELRRRDAAASPRTSS